ncbi:helix-turn-helix transcriptional regulator [Niameybacter massiliensis]|uniref:helix-turn-helix transcriptional regulator n=1 Tax=Niameybacter massiliensis TaxID=1658108 RepID=UPI0006B639A8|nr:AraC family transcriptional regulator [Niameybacter massiliensis]
MKHELEVIHHPNIKNMKIFLLDVAYRAPHFHPETEILLVIKGEPWVVINHEKYQFQPGDIIILNGNVGHEIISREQCTTFLCLQLLPEYFEGYFPNMKHVIFSDHCSYRIKHYFLILTFLGLGKIYFQKPTYYEIQCASFVNIIYFDLLSKYAHYEISEKEYLLTCKKSKRLNRIINYIEEHYSEKINLQDIAKQEGLSISFLSHFIKDNINYSFQEYLTLVRFNHARQLILTTNMKLVDVCYQCGFSDYRYLNQAFAKYCGCTPKEYKNQARSIIAVKQGRRDSLESYYSDEETIKIIDGAILEYKKLLVLQE